MMKRRLVISLLVLAATLASGAPGEKPAAVQLCFALPPGLTLYAQGPQLNYRPLSSDTWLLDAEVLFDGQVPERLTRDGADCLRAWLPAHPVTSLSVRFERTTLNLVNVEQKVDLKLKPDLWYEGGHFTVARAPWAHVSTQLPGTLTLERLGAAGTVRITELEQVPAGTYRVQYEAPARPTGPCSIALHATGVGTIRADNRKEQFEALVEQYRRDLLPEVVAHQKLACTDEESLEVSLRIVDGVYVSPTNPPLRRITVAARLPRYALSIDGTEVRFESGGRYELKAGQQVVLEQLAPGSTLASAP